MQIEYAGKAPLRSTAAETQPQPWLRRIIPVVSGVVFLLGWELVVQIADYPAFILPGPRDVAARALRVILDGSLLWHSSVTLLEVLGGLCLGATLAVLLGYALAKSIHIEQALSPYLIASQAIPVVAIAPLLVLWFGTGLTSKILISALIVFFPILINTVAGLRAAPHDLLDLMRANHATRWQIFRLLEAPAALPLIFAGLKVGATLSVIGAVVGEFAGARAGLGVLISVADGQYDTARMFVGVAALIALALALYGLVALAEKRVLRWRK